MADRIEPRYLTADQVCDYLSVSRGTIDKLVREKRIPAPIMLTPRLPRWDRLAIDATLVGTALSPMADHEMQIDAWFEEDNRRRQERQAQREARKVRRG